jgi:FecR protein
MRAIVCVLLPAALWAGQARYARLGEFEGKVEVQLGPAEPWTAAERNLPLPEGVWLRTGAASRVEVELDDGVVWRLGPDSQGELSDYTRLSTGQGVTVVSVDRGLAYLTGQARGNDAVALAAPGAQVTVTRPARVRVEAGEDASQIWVLAGTARFSSPAAELDLVQGQTTRVEPATPARFFLDRETPATGTDRWSTERDKTLTNPSAALHVMERYGLADLDAGGEWVHSDELGTVWKPQAGEGWLPFQKGRWRWYGALGYTWVGDEPWGWLPYHYGRWIHNKDLGWVWAPSLSQVFKPGEVYWMRGAQLAAWGPLAPGERFTPAPQTLPQQFYDAYTTFAVFEEGTAVIDPAGLAERPKEALKAAAFVAALPSPAFDASRLDATRPVTRAGSTRIRPVLPGVTYQGDEPPIVPYQPKTVSQAPASVARPVVIVNNPPPPPEPVAVPVLVPYPVAVPEATEPHKSRKKWQSDAERKIYQRVLADEANPAQQIRDLDEWRQKFPHTEHAADLAYFYMQAYNRTAPPDAAKILAWGATLMRADVKTLFEDDDFGRTQTLTVLYLPTVAVTKIEHPTAQQLQTAHWAARQLLSYIPEFFAAGHRPAIVTADMWQRARAVVEAAAKKTLAL